jgi:hypothetical protein
MREIAIGSLAWVLTCGCELGDHPEQVRLERSRVVYATDDRLELYLAPTGALREFGRRSVVALVNDAALAATSGSEPTALFSAPSWQERRNLCDAAPFAAQPAAASCSGVLVAKDLILTAGHCARNLDCGSVSVVFGYYYEREGEPAPLSADDVYRCADVPVFEVPSLRGDVDYGFVRLDRPASADKRPAALAVAATPVDATAPLYAFTFGGGVPLKLEPHVQVRDPRPYDLDYFVAALDSFEGASGGPLIGEDGRVVGVVSSGLDDYVPTAAGCVDVAVLPESEAAEHVTYAFRAAAGFCRDAPGTEPFCSESVGGARAPSCSLGVAAGTGRAWLSVIGLLLMGRSSSARLRRQRRLSRGALHGRRLLDGDSVVKPF